MHPFHIHARPGGPRRHTQTGRPARPLGGALRLLPIGTLLAWQLTVAVPAQARAGDLDPGFGTGGKVVTDIAGQLDEALAVAVQANGKIVAAGQNFGETSDFALARYRANGTLDAGFGTGGMVTTGFPGGATAAGLVVQAGGRLVAAGTADPGTGGTDRNFALVRYRHDGSLDPSFGVGGKVTTDFGANGLDRANALAVQADGRLVAAGSPNNFFGFGSDFGLARYLAG